jgi:Helix-turn-helix domain of resolvase
VIPDSVLMDHFRPPEPLQVAQALRLTTQPPVELHDAGTHTKEELAEPFSVSRTTIYRGLQRRAATASS